MKRLAALMILAVLAKPVQAQDVTITKGQGGEIIITGGKRTPPRVETQEETEARRAAQERAFESGTARTIQQQEAQARDASIRAVQDAEARDTEAARQRARDEEKLEQLQREAAINERRANKASSAYRHETYKDRQREAQSEADALRRKLSAP